MLLALLLSATLSVTELAAPPLPPLPPPPEFLALAAPPPGAAPLLFCTPEGFGVAGQEFQRAEHPIVEALQRTEPGSTVLLDAGDYEPFTLGLGSNGRNNADVSGGRAKAPVVIDGRDRARIVGEDGDAIGIDQRVRVSWITFRHLEIVPGRRAGVMFYKRQDNRDHVGFVFENVDIVGGFRHARGTGRRAKWGIWAHRPRNLVFRGTLEPAKVTGISGEHAFYIQNPQGRVLIENVEADGLGRTFVQVTARATDGPPGKGLFVVRDCKVANVGLSIDDGYHGGSAFTVAGRHRGRLLFEGNTFRGGFDPEIAALKPVGGVHGTGAFVAWQAGEPLPNGELILRGNDFRMANTCGDRPLVALSGCDVVRLQGANRFESGGFQPALAIDPVDEQGRPVGKPLGSLVLQGSVKLVGELLRAGETLKHSELQRFRPARGEKDR